MRVHENYRTPACIARTPAHATVARFMTASMLAALALFAAAAMLHSTRSHAQTDLFKCTDGQRVTYASTPCDKLGLKSAGAIADRITVISGERPAAKAAPAAAPKNGTDEDDKARKSAGAMKPVNPLVERLLK